MTRSTIRSRVIDVLEDSSGLDLARANDSVDFVELGLDSLFLTQASLALSKAFGVEVTFRQLSESLTSIGALCQHLADQGVEGGGDAPPTTSGGGVAGVAATATVSRQVSNDTPTAVPPRVNGPVGGAGRTEELIRAQLALMQYQLQVLSGHAVAAPTDAKPNAPASTGSEKGSVEPLAVSPQQSMAAQEPADPPKGGRGARITRSVGAGLSKRQTSFIADLVARYNAKTPGSKTFTQRYRARLADPRTVSGFNPLYKELVYPLVTRGSKGSRIWDIDGNEYIDHVCGFGPVLFGHSPDFIVSAVQSQVENGVETGPQAELAGEVAELVCELTGLERCAFASTGSEAVLGAIRLARTVTGRNKIVVFDGAYHGIVDEAIYRKGRAGVGLPAAPGIPREATANVLVLPWNDLDALNSISGIGSDLAAILVEPVQSRAPEIQPGELLRRLRKICDETGAALIMDEMITGFRMHSGGAQAHFGVRADLATYGKIVGGGYPLGIIAGSKRFMDALDGGFWSFGDDSIPTVGVTYFAGTFVRHPVALAAARAVLKKLRELGPALHEGLNRNTEELTSKLRGFLAGVSSPIEVHHCASWFEVTVPKEESYMPLLFALMRLKGFHVQDGRPFFLTTAHTQADLDAFVKAFQESVTELMLNDLLGGDVLAAHRHLKQAFLEPPVSGARLGRDAYGNPGWYVDDPNQSGHYLKVAEHASNSQDRLEVL